MKLETTDLFAWEPLPERAFDGETYKPSRDYQRMNGQLKAVYDLVRDGKWRSLRDICTHVHGSEAAISARLRDLRKEKYGSHTIERVCVEKGLWRYRLVRPA